MALRINMHGDISEDWRRQFAALQRKATRAIQSTMEEVRDDIKAAGDADIQAGGNFGRRWTDSLHVEVRRKSGSFDIVAFHTIPYAHVFETGFVVKGKPLLWVPLSGTDAVGKSASQYGGNLFYVDRSKRGLKPLLGSVSDGQMKYVGLDEAHLTKRFHLTEIFRLMSKKLKSVFKSQMGG